MRVINTANMEVVFLGEEWTHEPLPCSRQAIPLLEKNERVVTWLRPVGGTIADQVPAIMYKGRHYSLSLRMQKAIYRHVRLKKGFRNEEVMDGVLKLRIPDVLLKEKMRTQSRFDAMRKKAKEACSSPAPSEEEMLAAMCSDDEAPPAQQQQAAQPHEARRDRCKASCTVSARMRQVVDQLLACDEEQYAAAMQQSTVFVFKSQQSELITCFLDEMRRENTALYQQRQALLQVVAEAYDALAQH